MSSPTGTQVTGARLVGGGGRPEWWVCVCKRASPLEQTSGGREGHLGALKPHPWAQGFLGERQVLFPVGM